MTKFVLFIAMVALVGAAVFGVMNRKAYIEEMRLTQQLEQEYKETNALYVAAKDDLEQLKTQASEVKDARDKVAAEASQAKLELQRKTAEAQTKMAELEAKKAQLAELDIIKEKLRGRTPEMVKAEFERYNQTLADRQAELEKLKDEVLTAENAIEKNESTLVDLQEKEEERKQRIALNSMEADVIAINRDHGFVIVNAGEEQGVSSDSSLLVQRGVDRVARLRIVSVEPQLTVADIIPGSLTPGTQIKVRDKVIFENVRTN